MAVSSVQRTNKPWKMLASALLLVALLLNGEVMAQDQGGRGPQAPIRGDNILKPSATTPEQGQKPALPTVGPYTVQTTAATTTETLSAVPSTKAPEGTTATDEVKTNTPTGNPETPFIPPRGDNSNNKPKPKPPQEVVCVNKEHVEGKNAVRLKLKNSSDCSKTQMQISSVLPELCDEDCKLELYQEDHTKEVLVSGKYVEDDVVGMTNKLNNDNIKDKINVEEAVTRWGKNSKLVLVSLLLAGLLLAALLVAAYYLKTHHKNSKGVRLAESFQVDEENQANTLVSVAPLPQEPVDKPTVNGESPPENGMNPNPTTNGHSANQTQVADTEM
ncbi:hematopoietic progenitor cell antigen CD34 [Kryptolebias marmoratus]|uniref:Si:ch211-286o17.1 n=1 Tax=Kryptolebias marmoratus TaxID=37003 RepID=A0A3Q3B1Q7_KRYMA|nr:hematopoietic progenitor cell antigen CD34 [Kryptolebias marmoratus]